MDFAPPRFLAFKRFGTEERVTSIVPAIFPEGLLLTQEDIQRASILIRCLESAVVWQLQEMHTRFLDKYETTELNI